MNFIITLKVIPSSKKTVCILDANNQLKCYVKSPPKGGRANQELLDFLAHRLRIPKNKLLIVSGFTGSKKRIVIACQLTKQEFYSALGIDVQHTLLD